MPGPNNAKAKKIRELKAEGLNQTQIAKELGVTQTAISKMCRTHKITGWFMGAAARDQTGDKNPAFKNGLSKSTIERTARESVLRMKRNLRKCERCGNINQDKNHVIHHKNRDRSDNIASNLEVLCTPCHNIEHSSERGRDPITGRYLW